MRLTRSEARQQIIVAIRHGARDTVHPDHWTYTAQAAYNRGVRLAKMYRRERLHSDVEHAR